jgi:hypothetical protein
MQWTAVAPLAPMPMPMQAPITPAAGVVITGPNHALHFILTLFTFWACGGWAWIWLVVALDNSRKIQTVDMYGRPILPPRPPPGTARPPSHPFLWFTALSTRDRVLLVGAVVVVFVIFVIAAR